jgi:Protein of unknown function (DUF2934)
MAKRTTTATPTTRKRATNNNSDAGVAEAPKPNGQSAPMDIEPTEDDIRLRAYHRYLERGGEQGTDFDDWVEAERDLRLPRHN